MASLEEHIKTRLGVLIPNLELEPVSEDSNALVTYTFATTGRVNRLVRVGTLALHFYGATPLAAFNASYDQEMDIEDALTASEGANYTINACQFDTRLPISDEETGEFINVECTYSVQYTIRRA